VLIAAGTAAPLNHYIERDSTGYEKNRFEAAGRAEC